MNYSGWAIYVDCDIIVKEDITQLWELKDPSKAIMCVQHNYITKSDIKFLKNANKNYEKKNWSSVMLINCGHPSLQKLTPTFVQESSGKTLHQFKWLDESLLGALPVEWNWLVGEYLFNTSAKLLHYTLGAPCFEEYRNGDHASDWLNEMRYIAR
jgi:lipopolysaccharide biosynthesis glycosyltransferase